MSGENPARFQVGWGLDSRVRGNDEGLRKGLRSGARRSNVRRRRSVVARYRRQQAVLRAAFLSMGLARLCADCTDRCCGHFSFGQLTVPADRAVLPPDVLPTVDDAAAPCRQLSSTGCALPIDRRPWVCVRHTCERWERSLTAQQAAELERAFERLDSLFAELPDGPPLPAHPAA